MSFQIVTKNNIVYAVFTSRREYRRMQWLFYNHKVHCINGYPAVKLLAWNKASVFDAMLHG